ncbi:MAG: hypothetical protein GXN93_01900 [Candidatus Diapherotrites archaeon]|nr:hypothetical protein [Candidatus Diapherotrites archaeon]
MGSSTVLSVRVPKKVVTELKRMGAPIQQIVRETLEQEYRKRILQHVESKTRKLVSSMGDDEIIRSIEEGRA